MFGQMILPLDHVMFVFGPVDLSPVRSLVAEIGIDH